jgi:TRAP-type C4-dicarboxylate transport system permease small subunit
LTSILLGILSPLAFLNTLAGTIGKRISVVAIALMVAVTLLQVFCRYVLNNALPWPDEAARFLMLWLTGLMGPVALRQGGFVAIETIHQYFSNAALKILSIVLLVMMLIVLVVAIKLGWKHVNSGWLFASSSLRIPLDLIGMKIVKVKLAWMYMSLFVGVVLMTLVTVELLLRQIVRLLGGENELRPIPIVADVKGAE